MARDGPGWEDPLISDIYSTVDVDMKRNNALLTMARMLRESDDEGRLGPSPMTNNPQATVSCAMTTNDYISEITS
jgi:hypothetical protein